VGETAQKWLSKNGDKKGGKQGWVGSPGYVCAAAFFKEVTGEGPRGEKKVVKEKNQPERRKERKRNQDRNKGPLTTTRKRKRQTEQKKRKRKIKKIKRKGKMCKERGQTNFERNRSGKSPQHTVDAPGRN